MPAIMPFVLADAAPTAAPAATPSLFSPITLIYIAAIFAIFYFLMIRPQKKKEKERQDMLSKVQRGDRVVTIGGMFGEVESVKEDYVILLVDPERGTTIKFRRSAVHEILARDSTEPDKK